MSGLQHVDKTTASFSRPSVTVSRVVRSQYGTQDTQETGSYDFSDGESVARFPAFHFSLHRVTPLSALVRTHHDPTTGSSFKATVLAAVLEVDGPDTIRIKRGADAGKEVSILKLILGDEDGAVCKLTAWREIAEVWGGSDPDIAAPGIKRGDVVLLESAFLSDACAHNASFLIIIAALKPLLTHA